MLAYICESITQLCARHFTKYSLAYIHFKDFLCKCSVNLILQAYLQSALQKYLHFVTLKLQTFKVSNKYAVEEKHFHKI